MNTSAKTLSILAASALSLAIHTHANEDNAGDPGKTFSTTLTIRGHAKEDSIQIDGAKIGHWTMDFDAAKEIAAVKKLPILVNFTGSDWCGWCKKMDEDVFAKAPWMEYAAENTLLVTIDFPREKSIVPEKFVARNKELKEKYAIRGYPTYVILDSDGETKIGQLGAGRDKTPESFIAEFKKVVRNSASGMEAFAKENPEKAEAYKAAVGNLNDRKKALADWHEANQELLKELSTLQREVKAAETALSKF